MFNNVGKACNFGKKTSTKKKVIIACQRSMCEKILVYLTDVDNRQ